MREAWRGTLEEIETNTRFREHQRKNLCRSERIALVWAFRIHLLLKNYAGNPLASLFSDWKSIRTANVR